jgi:hypothetical protein
MQGLASPGGLAEYGHYKKYVQDEKWCTEAVIERRYLSL